jgi:methyltransferase (TIGR00027 family)
VRDGSFAPRVARYPRGVRGDTASETARRVAAHRLACPRLSTAHGRPGDDEVLSRDVARGVDIRFGRMHRYLCRRTSFFDRVVVDALDAGVTQVVIVGAGYDGRAMRYARHDATFFEVDHPATQADKRARLERLGLPATGIRFVTVDLTVDPLADRLAAAGHDPALPSCLVVEGLASYLEVEVLDATLRELRSVTAAGSVLAVSVGVARGDVEARIRAARFRSAVAALGEPIRNELTPDAFEVLLAATGWRLVRLTTGPDEAAAASASGLVAAAPMEGAATP